MWSNPPHLKTVKRNNVSEINSLGSLLVLSEMCLVVLELVYCGVFLQTLKQACALIRESFIYTESERFHWTSRETPINSQGGVERYYRPGERCRCQAIQYVGKIY